MARSKKITVRVVADAVQVGGRFYPNGAVLDVRADVAKDLLDTGQVVDTEM